MSRCPDGFADDWTDAIPTSYRRYAETQILRVSSHLHALAPPRHLFGTEPAYVAFTNGTAHTRAMPALCKNTPLGPVTLIEEGGAIVRLEWDTGGDEETGLLVEAHRQLAAYFAGDLTEFDLPLAPNVSPTQQRFLDALVAIPFGETKTYGQIARETGMSAQGAGQACGANPIAIIIPCHRIVGADNLGGFSAAGGVEAKVALLKHEGAASLLI